jgi:hypothetical protein
LAIGGSNSSGGGTDKHTGAELQGGRVVRGGGDEDEETGFSVIFLVGKGKRSSLKEVTGVISGAGPWALNQFR